MEKITVPFFSVIIDAYNLGTFIEEAIESVLVQTFPKDEIEIIVVDDGSTDDTAKRLKRYLHRVEYVYKTNGGQASAFNTGFARSRGDFIVLLDADDYFHPDKLQKLSDIYNRYHCSAAFHNLSVVTTCIRKPLVPYLYYQDPRLLRKAGPGTYILSGKDHTDLMPAYFLVPTSGQSYSRALCEKIFPVPEYFTHSADLYLHLHALVQSDIYFLNIPLACYREHPYSDNQFNRQNIRWHERRIAFYLRTLRALEDAFGAEGAVLVGTVRNDLHLMYIVLERLKKRYRAALNHFWIYKAPGPFPFRITKMLRAVAYLIAPPQIYGILRSFYHSFHLKNLLRFIIRE